MAELNKGFDWLWQYRGVIGLFAATFFISDLIWGAIASGRLAKIERKLGIY